MSDLKLPLSQQPGFIPCAASDVLDAAALRAMFPGLAAVLPSLAARIEQQMNEQAPEDAA
jgi:hypothetical protein